MEGDRKFILAVVVAAIAAVGCASPSYEAALRGRALSSESHPGARIIEADADAGDVYELAYTKSRSDRPGRATAIIEVRVDEVTPAGFELSWTTREVAVESSSLLTVDPAIESLMKMSEGSRVRFETDPYLLPTRVLNTEEIVAFNRQMIDQLFAQIDQRAGERAGLVRQALTPVFEQLQRPESIELQVLEAPRLFFLFSNVDVDALPIEFDDELPSPFGGSTIPARSRFRLEAWDAAAEEAHLVYEMEADPEKSAETMRSFVEGLIEAAPKAERAKLEAELLDLEVEFHDITRVVVDLRDGLARSVAYVRTLQAGPRSRLETMTLERR